MGFDYQVTDTTFDISYKVWEHLLIKKECRTPGVYILFDITGEVLYVGSSGARDSKVGDRVYGHIHGSVESKKLEFQKRIFEIKLFTFEDSTDGKYKMNICEHWTKMSYPPLFSKDSFAYNTQDTREYWDKSNDGTLWKNWHRIDEKGAEYQKNLIEAGLKLS
ncbi:hypothetical protein ACQVWD_26520 [Bacillus cereus]|nr:hypothetical protein [Bacillus cereus]